MLDDLSTETTTSTCTRSATRWCAWSRSPRATGPGAGAFTSSRCWVRPTRAGITTCARDEAACASSLARGGGFTIPTSRLRRSPPGFRNSTSSSGAASTGARRTSSSAPRAPASPPWRSPISRPPRTGRARLILSFDETVGILLRRAASIGYQLQPHLESGLLRIEQVDPAEISAGAFSGRIRDAVEADRACIVLIDSSPAT